MLSTSLEKYSEFLTELLNRTRTLIKERYRSTPKKKRDGTLVTAADTEAELLCRTLIKARYPEHGIVGEEFPEANAGAEYVWYLDPIDGTQNFVHGIPTFGTIVALYYKGEPLVAAIDHPFLDRRYVAMKGKGVTLNGEYLSKVEGGMSSHDIIGISPPFNFERAEIPVSTFERILRLHPHFRIYYDCFAHSLTAEGALAATLDVDLKIWDIAATKLLVEEGGGKFLILSRSRKNGEETYNCLFGKPSVVDYLESKIAAA